MQTQQTTDVPARSRGAISPDNDDDTLLNSAQTRAKAGGVSDMCIWRWMRDDRVQFPRPVQINRRNYWKQGDVRRWLVQRMEQKAAA